MGEERGPGGSDHIIERPKGVGVEASESTFLSVSRRVLGVSSFLGGAETGTREGGGGGGLRNAWSCMCHKHAARHGRDGWAARCGVT